MNSNLHAERQPAAPPTPSSMRAPPGLVQRRCACAGTLPANDKCERRRQNRLADPKPKLVVNLPGDRYEQEADRIADQVMRMPTPDIQKRCVSEEQEKMLPAQETGAQSPALARSVESEIRSLLQSGGRPLDLDSLAFMESRFGHDFGRVRVHTGPRAAEAAQAMEARAFTIGRHMVFDQGEHAPETAVGRRLLAHELAHTVQQTAREGRSGAGLLVQRQPQTRKERRADRRQRRKEARERRRDERKRTRFKDPEPIVVQPSVIKIVNPAYDRRNPIGRILREEPVGLTTPTINGTPLPDDYARAGQLVLNALAPKQTAYNPTTKECRFAEFDVTLSSNVIVPTEPRGGRWTMNIPGSEVRGLSVCHSRESVPVTMTGIPDSKTIFDWIARNEQEHVDDLEKEGRNHLEPYLTALRAARATGENTEKCQETLLAWRGNKDGLAVKGFLDAWLASIRARDAGGGHNLKNDIEAKSGCAAIEIASRT